MEQLAFQVEPATVSAQRSARRDHAVAWHNDGNWIPVVRHANGTVGVRMADGLRDVAVATCFAIGNIEQGAPTRELKFGSAEIERNRELAALSGKIFLKLVKIGSEIGFGLL